ncbi:MAG TPA: hypothetical protein VH247_08120 [Thermoleophilaceae bacterium]|jgi:hypothetical protein|nr:hypothetical protein [Thermoleophilaceae bacterium]
MKRIIGIVALAGALAVPVVAIADQPTSTDKSNAAKECKSLLRAEGTSNFTHAWGAHGKGKAYGKCVSSKAKEEAAERQAAKSNAAKQCKTEQATADADFRAAHDGKSFAETYGAKNANSAYGKCVSTNAKKNKEAADQQDKDTITAAKFCKGEQSKPEFKTTYKNFGQCVSKKAHELNAQRQQEQQQTPTQS